MILSALAHEAEMLAARLDALAPDAGPLAPAWRAELAVRLAWVAGLLVRECDAIQAAAAPVAERSPHRSRD